MWHKYYKKYQLNIYILMSLLITHCNRKLQIYYISLLHLAI